MEFKTPSREHFKDVGSHAASHSSEHHPQPAAPMPVNNKARLRVPRIVRRWCKLGLGVFSSGCSSIVGPWLCSY